MLLRKIMITAVENEISILLNHRRFRIRCEISMVKDFFFVSVYLHQIYMNRIRQAHSTYKTAVAIWSSNSSGFRNEKQKIKKLLKESPSNATYVEIVNVSRELNVVANSLLRYLHSSITRKNSSCLIF